MSKPTPVISSHDSGKEGSMFSYTIGYISSIVLTIAAYVLVVNDKLNHTMIVVLISLFAIIQFSIQVLFFLHLGRESKPRYKLMAFLFMLLIVLTIVIGSIWIMNDLNYRMTPEQMNTYLKSQDGL